MSNPYCGGTLDSYYETHGPRVLWVEYKFLSHLPKEILRPFDLLSGLQQKWYDRALRNKVEVATIVGFSDGGFIFAADTVYATYTRVQLTNMLLSRQTIAAWISKQLGVSLAPSASHRKCRASDGG